jgi:hypothetical protein
MYGFGVGSKIKKGDCGYKSKNKEDLFESMKRWYDIDKIRNCESSEKKCITKLLNYKFDVTDHEKEIPGLGLYMEVKTEFYFDREDYITK